jgi:predicted KAP-like P-loop ATPase
MKEIIYDLPKECLEEDIFGWAPIVNRISDLIIHQSKKHHSCFTIGIYGRWGEGKTSLMNMVCDNLKDQRRIKIIHFNPWLFKDQESLLVDFFKTLQSGITNKKVVEKIKRYGPLVSIGISGLLNLALPGAGSLLKGSLDQVVDAVSDIKFDLTSLKKEVDECIKLSKQQYLIVIDDVDRLDKDELHTLFKLIRQNADFMNTTYMIGMDAELVAKSIGCRFESGDEKSGKNFLEKIIQVPFFVPKVQRGHLNKMLNTLLLPKIEILLSESGKRTTKIDEIKESLNLYVSPLFNSAREIIVYINSLTIILPLVYKDVNISDLCLLEALKLFHPKGYNVIRQNKLIITDSIEPSFKDIGESPEIRQHKRDDFIEKLFENIESDKTLYLKEIIERLLGPFISPRYHNNVHTLNKKSICSSYYFNNYFQYTHPDDIISDDETDKLIEDLSLASQEELIERFEFYYKTYGIDELKRVVYLILPMKNTYNINNDTVGLICVVFTILSNGMSASPPDCIALINLWN